MNWKKFRRKARRWVRRHRLHLLAACVLAVIVLLLAGTGHDEYDEFLEELGFRESSNDYTVVNRFGYMGRYQLGSLALREIGFMDENSEWTPLANSYGIYSQEDFLNSPEAQDAAVRAYHEKTYVYIKALGLDAYVGSTYCGVRVTESGLLAACHLVGVVGMQRGLQTGEHVYDGNHVSASVYMELFAGYDISSIWSDGSA